jgi:gamma-glutamyltranspeptidase / glutathione hydrolase
MKLPELDFASHRSPVMGRNGMVASSQPLATAAGLKVLAQGGSAADAAVATAAALNVTEPTSTGLGGDAFALFYHAAERRVYALNGSGRAPAAISLDRLRREGLGEELPPYHPYTVTVPGACAAWCDMVERFGRMSMAEVLAPARQLAEEGYPVAPLTALSWQGAARRQLREAVNGVELTIEGRGPQPGEIFRNPGLVRTFDQIISGGKDAYYRGPIAEAIAAVMREAGGCLDEQDLAAHHSTWEEPIRASYRGLNVWECAPNGQGLAALLALQILEGFELRGHAPLSPARLHLLIEALRLGFADAFYYVADPDFRPAPLNQLLSQPYAAARRALIDPNCAAAQVDHGLPLASSDTVYFSVVDGEGNACSFINSNYMGFGTGIVPRGWGFSLQNRGHNFSLKQDHPNMLEPRKRPYHTIIPAMVTREADQSLFACYGVMGGFMQPQGHVQVLTGLVDDGLDPQSALDRPRFCITPDLASGEVSLEEGIPVRTMAALADMGHAVRPVSGLGRGLFGRGQVIYRDPENGVLWGGSDPRADGCAMTLIG